MWSPSLSRLHSMRCDRQKLHPGLYLAPPLAAPLPRLSSTRLRTTLASGPLRVFACSASPGEVWTVFGPAADQIILIADHLADRTGAPRAPCDGTPCSARFLLPPQRRFARDIVDQAGRCRVQTAPMHTFIWPSINQDEKYESRSLTHIAYEI
jgi:hypothetical protein